MRSGGQVIVDHLICNGVDKVFSVPGESFLGAMDAFYERSNEIKFINCRQEGSAAFMAAAYGRITGKPGVCFVTRGPGATNASIGVHVAAKDSVPMLLFVGQVATSSTHRDAFQEIDIPAMFKPLAKWSVQIDSADRLPEILSRATKISTSGRPGPVVISLPENVQREIVDAGDPVFQAPIIPSTSRVQVEQFFQLVGEAENPLIVLGSSTWSEDTCQQIADFAERSEIPVVASFRCQDRIDNDHPNYVGVLGVGTNPLLSKRIDDSDLLIMLGVELSEIVTEGFTKFTAPKMKQRLVHVHPDQAELGRIYQPDLGINSAIAGFAASISGMSLAPDVSRKTSIQELRRSYQEFTTPGECPGDVQIGKILHWLDSRLPADTFISCGAGNYTHWVLRFLQHRKFGTQLAPLGAVMGYSVPAAIAASLQYPDRMAVSFSGDGCFLMNAQDLATAKKYSTNPVFIVINNGMYGAIRMHQERAFPTRTIGCDLENPDFVAYAEAFGIAGFRVSKTSQFQEAFEQAAASSTPSLIELVVSEQAITPAFTLDELVERSIAAQKG